MSVIEHMEASYRKDLAQVTARAEKAEAALALAVAECRAGRDLRSFHNNEVFCDPTNLNERLDKAIAANPLPEAPRAVLESEGTR